MAENDTKAAFQIDLEGNLESTSLDAAKALEQLRTSIERDTKALASLQSAMKRLQSGSVVNVQQFRALQAQIQGTKDRIAQAQGAILDLGGGMERGRRGSSRFAEAMKLLEKQSQGLGGPLGTVSSRMSNLRALIAGNVLTFGVVALAAGFAALTAAVIIATGAMLKFGIASANARRSELLQLEGLTKLRSIWGLAAGNAGEIQQAIDRTSSSVSLGREEVNRYAVSLYKAGLRGQNLADALDATAIKAATQGQEAAGQFAGLASSIALAGGSVKKLADNVRARLGGVAAAQMLDLNVQAQKMRENIGAIFTGLKIEGFLKALKDITDLFAQSTVTGQALKVLATTVFQPMVNAIEYLMPLGKRFFQGMVIGVQVLIIALLKLAVAFKRTFGKSELLKGLNLQNVALKAGVFAVGALVTPVVLLTAAFAALAVPVAAVGAAFYGLGSALVSAFEFVTETDWKALGTSICEGIVNGLKAGASWVVDGMKKLATGAWSAFKNTLGIHSPSREFAKLGVQLPAGVEHGIDQGAPSLERSVAGMVTPPAAPQASGAARGGSSSASVHIDTITIQTSSGSAQDIARDIRMALEEVLSGVAVQMGAA